MLSYIFISTNWPCSRLYNNAINILQIVPLVSCTIYNNTWGKSLSHKKLYTCSSTTYNVYPSKHGISKTPTHPAENFSTLCALTSSSTPKVCTINRGTRDKILSHKKALWKYIHMPQNQQKGQSVYSIEQPVRSLCLWRTTYSAMVSVEPYVDIWCIWTRLHMDSTPAPHKLPSRKHHLICAGFMLEFTSSNTHITHTTYVIFSANIVTHMHSFEWGQIPYHLDVY